MEVELLEGYMMMFTEVTIFGKLFNTEKSGLISELFNHIELN